MVIRGEIWKRLAPYPLVHRLARKLYPALAIGVSATVDRRHLRSIQAIEAQIQELETTNPNQKAPVVIFDVEPQPTRLTGHTATSRAIGWALRLAGQSVVHVVCQRGVPQCLFGGAERRIPNLRPPCSSCTYLRQQFYPEKLIRSFRYDADRWAALEIGLQNLSITELMDFEYKGLQIGRFCSPSVRWLLRRHDLMENQPAHDLMVRFVLGSVSFAESFERLIDELRPRAAVIYNGAFYTEATAVAVANKHGIPVISHELGWVAGRMFISHDAATRYKIDMPSSFEMSRQEEQELETYLSQRFSGDFKMGATRFWPEMRVLSPFLRKKVSQFRQVVSIFTNVIFDTSQLYANTLFKDMFAWLTETVTLANDMKDTLFLIRVHPDEFLKESQETVAEWFSQRPERKLPNVVLISANEYISSYDLIRCSKFVVVYNSTVGLEAMVLGKPVICGGETRYLNATAAVRPSNPVEYRGLVRQYANAKELSFSNHDRQQARRYLYYTYFKACLDLSRWIGTDSVVGDQQLGTAADFHPDDSLEMNILVRGILKGDPFVYP